MSLEEFFQALATDSEIRDVVDQVLRTCNDDECGECITSRIDYYYHKWLFTRKVDRRIVYDLKKCIEGAE